MLFSIRHFPEVDSTNREAIRWAKTHAGADAVAIVADRQSAAYGKKGRAWVAEEGNLYLSLLLRPNSPLSDAQQLVYVAALAAQQSLAKLHIGVQLKWPNDVMLDGKKLGGILLESGMKGGALDYVVVGVGINIAHAPKNIDQQTVSLLEVACDTTRDHTLEQFLQSFGELYKTWQAEGFPPIKSQWEEHAYGMGQWLVASTPQKRVEGAMQGLDDAGNLLLMGQDGMPHTIITADIFFGK